MLKAIEILVLYLRNPPTSDLELCVYERASECRAYLAEVCCKDVCVSNRSSAHEVCVRAHVHAAEGRAVVAATATALGTTGSW